VIFASDSGHTLSLPPVWMVAPFAILLLMIATGPLFYHHFWEYHYPKLAIGLGTITVGYYLFVLHETAPLLHTLEEYISFIALLTALFVASGGILIEIDKKGKPFVNIGILCVGSILSNFIGTTGASMLLIRPFMRVNKGRLRPYHVIFFIFLVSNIGGGLTPIGDPPLFLGFLKGVPFFWVISKVLHIWAFAIVILLIIFFMIDSRNTEVQEIHTSGKIKISGTKNFIYLGIVIGSVFLDPGVIKSGWLHEFLYWIKHELHILGLREIIMFSVAYLSYKTADKNALAGNEFNFEPIKEVAYLFVGIFATMIPALALIANYAHENADIFTVSKFYWFTGSLSGVLDNAPTYLNFLAGAMGKFGQNIGNANEVLDFAQNEQSVIYLMAISVAAVFFGAMTYIGNAPNFMVKNIAEQSGVDVPSFVGYIVKYSIPILVPVFFIVWFLFFNY